MQPSELVTEEMVDAAWDAHAESAGYDDIAGIKQIRDALEAVALDLYERGRKDGRDDGLREAAAETRVSVGWGGYGNPLLRTASQIEAAILSKLRSAT